jgi:phage terminase Nu1 subunit (DNA packaging protein)
MWTVGSTAYSSSVDEKRIPGLIPQPSVTVEAAADLTNVSIETIRAWASRGDVVIETRGDMEIVRLEDVRSVASRHRGSRFGALRDRLREASPLPEDVVSVVDLQELARERGSSD